MRHLVLVGLMAAGKTTVGELCANQMEYPFVDTDRVIEAIRGMPVVQIFAESGEDSYRDIEEDVVGNALLESEPHVISCGGGAVLRESTRRAMQKHGFVVWLRADPTTLVSRVGSTGSRPLLSEAPIETLKLLAAQRDDLYREVADEMVDTTEQTPDQTAEAVIALFEKAAS